MRRKDREVSDINKIESIIKKCDSLTLALNDEESGFPYILPLNFGYEVMNGKLLLFFHSALEGKKVELMKKDNRASFQMDTDHELLYNEDRGYCTMNYKSVVGRGRIKIIEDYDEKIKALKNLMRHNHNGIDKYFNDRAVSRTLVYQLEVDEIIAKVKK